MLFKVLGSSFELGYPTYEAKPGHSAKILTLSNETVKKVAWKASGLVALIGM